MSGPIVSYDVLLRKVEIFNRASGAKWLKSQCHKAYADDKERLRYRYIKYKCKEKECKAFFVIHIRGRFLQADLTSKGYSMQHCHGDTPDLPDDYTVLADISEVFNGIFDVDSYPTFGQIRARLDDLETVPSVNNRVDPTHSF